LFFSPKRGAGCVAGWARRGYRRAGRRGLGEKRISFLAETLSKLRFSVLYSSSTLSTSKNI
jgi:hypothetical protein